MLRIIVTIPVLLLVCLDLASASGAYSERMAFVRLIEHIAVARQEERNKEQPRTELRSTLCRDIQAKAPGIIEQLRMSEGTARQVSEARRNGHTLQWEMRESLDLKMFSGAFSEPPAAPSSWKVFLAHYNALKNPEQRMALQSRALRFQWELLQERCDIKGNKYFLTGEEQLGLLREALESSINSEDERRFGNQSTKLTETLIPNETLSSVED